MAGQRSGAARAKGAGKGNFTIARTSESHAPATARGSAALSSVDAIVALQAVDDPGERRRKAVQQGSDALDVLDDLKIALLSGHLPPEKLNQLKAVVEGYKDGELDPELANVLRGIDLRARVELAKHSKKSR